MQGSVPISQPLVQGPTYGSGFQPLVPPGVCSGLPSGEAERVPGGTRDWESLARTGSLARGDPPCGPPALAGGTRNCGSEVGGSGRPCGPHALAGGLGIGEAHRLSRVQTRRRCESHSMSTAFGAAAMGMDMGYEADGSCSERVVCGVLSGCWGGYCGLYDDWAHFVWWLDS